MTGASVVSLSGCGLCLRLSGLRLCNAGRLALTVGVRRGSHKIAPNVAHAAFSERAANQWFSGDVSHVHFVVSC